MDIAKKWKEFVGRLNDKGVPVPMARDPKTGKGSVSLSMVVVSFGLMSLCAMLAMAMVVNKWAGFFSEDAESLTALKEAFFMAFQMAGLSVGLYWGRKFQKDDKGGVIVDGGKAENE